MRVYDCDDPAQFAILDERIDGEGLIDTKTLQAFAPDLLSDARNRGFKVL
jgi:hypothetical protein